MDLADLEARIVKLENQKNDLVKKIQAISVEIDTDYYEGVRDPLEEFSGNKWRIEPRYEETKSIKISSEVKEKYQDWYTISHAIISEVLPNRLSEFENLYIRSKGEYESKIKDLLKHEYLEEDYRGTLIDLINNQFYILKAAFSHAKNFGLKSKEVEKINTGRMQLEQILKNTGKIIEDFDVNPKQETEVTKAVFNVIKNSVCVDASYGKVSINKPTKVYKPDIGIRSLKCAIEFKFADSKDELKKCLGGIYEDINGYSGSLDWQYFYAVVYMTSHFCTQEEIDIEFKQSEVSNNWKPIIVIGKGRRKKP